MSFLFLIAGFYSKESLPAIQNILSSNSITLPASAGSALGLFI